MATDYYKEKATIEGAFKVEADNILAEAKRAWEELGLCEEWDSARANLTSRLEAAKERAVSAEAAMFDRMRADMDAAHSKPLTQGQAANLQAVALVGVNRDNAAAAFESVRGNALGVTTLLDLAAKSVKAGEVIADLPDKPEPLDRLKRGLAQVQENRESKIRRYGGRYDVDVSGPDAVFFDPSGKDNRMTAAQAFLDEYGA